MPGYASPYTSDNVLGTGMLRVVRLHILQTLEFGVFHHCRSMGAWREYVNVVFLWKRINRFLCSSMTNLVLILMKQTLKMTTRNFNEGLAQRCTVQPALRPSSIVSITGFVQGIVSSYQPDTGHRFPFVFKHLHSVLRVEVDVLSEDPLAVTSAGAVCVYSFVPSVRRQALNRRPLQRSAAKRENFAWESSGCGSESEGLALLVKLYQCYQWSLLSTDWRPAIAEIARIALQKDLPATPFLQWFLLQDRAIELLEGKITIECKTQTFTQANQYTLTAS